jgi:EAL domain-containing protein (putative c-di-GMP-specific phosphodiesterase class I)/FixJ family two-component response regulator
MQFIRTAMSGTEAAKPKLLVVDDDVFYQKLLGTSMQGVYDICFSGNTHVSATLIEHLSCVILDLKVPGSDTISFIKLLEPYAKNIDLVLISGATEKTLFSAKKLAQHYNFKSIKLLAKPFSLTKIKDLIFTNHIASSWEEKVAVEQVEVKGEAITQQSVAQGLYKGQFVCHYQIQACIHTKKITGVEALARWRHPALGLLTPASFIKIANRKRFASKFFLAILDVALREFSETTEKTDCDLTISVNLAPVALMQPDLYDKISKLLQQHRVESHKLIIEITEQSLDEFDIVSMCNIARLRINDIQISIDDFGTGGSNFRRLRSIGFDEIKIDKSFIDDIAHCENSRSIVKSIAKLACDLKIRLVIEGIENSTQLLWVTNSLNNSDTIVQGYFFSKPVDARNLFNLLNVNCGYSLLLS